MNIAFTDARRYGKQRRYYVLKSGASDNGLLPTGMTYDKATDAIVGNPSPENWREVNQKDFPAESLVRLAETF